MAEKKIDPCKLFLKESDENETYDSVREKCESYGEIKYFHWWADKKMAVVRYDDQE